MGRLGGAPPSSAAALRTSRLTINRKHRAQLQAPKTVAPPVRGSATPNDFHECLAAVRTELVRLLRRLSAGSSSQTTLLNALAQLGAEHERVVARLLVELSQMPKTRPSLVAGLIVSQTGKQQAARTAEVRAAAQQQYSV